MLYCGLILTDDGIKVIEFNARFGDPETQVVLERLESPLSQYLFGAAQGNLAALNQPSFSSDAAVIVVLASAGYPEGARTGGAIRGISGAGDPHPPIAHAHLVHAATARDETGAWVATGGRVIGAVGRGPSIAQARESAYLALHQLELDGAQFRTDIAAKL